MRRTWIVVPLLLVFPAVAYAGGKPADAPTVVVRVKSLDALLQNLNLVVGLIGQEKEAHKIEALIKSKIGAKGLEGADPKRPFGIYARFGKSFDDINGAILIPIADEKAFLKMLDNAGVAYARDKDGIYTHKTDKNVDLYFRFAHKYLYVTSVSTDGIQDKNLADPTKALAVPGDATIALLARVEQVPDAVKLIALEKLKDAIADAQKQPTPGETKLQKDFRVATLGELNNLGASLIRDASELRLDLDVNDTAKELTVNFSIKPKPGTALAKTIKSLGDLKSPLANLPKKDFAFHGSLHVALPDALNQAFIAVVREVRDGAVKGIQDEAKKAQARALFDGMMPTAEAGEFQIVVAALGPKQERYTFLGALKLKDGAKLGTTVRDLLTLALKDIPEDQRGKVKLDFDAVGPVKIHRFELPKDAKLDPFLNDVIGDNHLHLAFRDDALFVALGKDALPALKEALAKSAVAASPPLVFDVDVARLAPLMAQTEKQKDLAAKQFPPGSEGRLRFLVAGGASLDVRLQMRFNVLQFLVKMKDG